MTNIGIKMLQISHPSVSTFMSVEFLYYYDGVFYAP